MAIRDQNTRPKNREIRAKYQKSPKPLDFCLEVRLVRHLSAFLPFQITFKNENGIHVCVLEIRRKVKSADAGIPKNRRLKISWNTFLPRRKRTIPKYFRLQKKMSQRMRKRKGCDINFFL